jgi:hypothetical protein
MGEVARLVVVIGCIAIGVPYCVHVPDLTIMIMELEDCYLRKSPRVDPATNKSVSYLRAGIVFVSWLRTYWTELGCVTGRYIIFSAVAINSLCVPMTAFNYWLLMLLSHI